MKINLTTNKKDAASTILNLQNLRRLNELDGVEFKSYEKDYENYDVILLMGYDHNIKSAREANKNALVGVIDPRMNQKRDPLGADFILANGVEMEDYCYKYTDNVLKYYIYPVVNEGGGLKEHKETNKITIGYHGNKIHLNNAYPRVIKAIDELAREIDVELIAIYNVDKLGEISWRPKNFKLSFAQWTEDVYDKYLPKVDIGVIPNLIPIENECKKKKKISSWRKKYKENENDYLMRFKETSNAGRIFPFMQFGIPVVSDMFPSATRIIDDGVDSYVAYSVEAWRHKLQKLSMDSDLRAKMGERLANKFRNKYSTRAMNLRLIEFLRNVKAINK